MGVVLLFSRDRRRSSPYTFSETDRRGQILLFTGTFVERDCTRAEVPAFENGEVRTDFDPGADSNATLPSFAF